MFKVGDRVKCIDNNRFEDLLKKEKEYKVLNIDKDGFIQVLEEYGAFKPDRFILIKKTTGNINIYDSIIKELREVYVAKNNDYGNSVGHTYDLFGDVSFATRINDKISRANTLITKGNQQVTDEKLEDTIKDMVNYGILWLIERQRVKEDIE